jgi:hypothetical protein
MKVDTSNSITLGENSYAAIVNKIYQKLNESRGSTIEGDEYLKEMYRNLFESTTPMLAIKPYITGSEILVKSDPNVNEVMSYCKGIINKGDMNFIINLAKEEHVQNLRTINHPDPFATIKSLNESFDQSAALVVENIKKGTFDTLNSRLLKDIKLNLNITEEPKHSSLMESILNMDFQQKGDKLIQYCPVGIMFEDRKNNRLIYLVENDVLSYDNEKQEFINLNEDIESIGLSDSQYALMNAINTAGYIPKDGVFSLNENWDFHIELTKTGNVFVNKKEMPNEKVQEFLMESIQFYENNPGKVKDFNKMKFIRDADCFNLLCQNSDLLVKFDKLSTIRNLHENTYILLDKENVFEINTPKILSDSKSRKETLFESFEVMVNAVNELLVVPITELFEAQLVDENLQKQELSAKLVNLQEEQSLINQHILEVRKLKAIAEENSPALEKLMEQENLLNEKLLTNIKDIKEISL